MKKMPLILELKNVKFEERKSLICAILNIHSFIIGGTSMKVFVHLAAGFEEIEALTIVDVLRRADVAVQMVSVMDDLEVTGARGITVKADLLFENADYNECEMMVFPGGMLGTTNMANHEPLMMQLREFVEGKKWLAAICAAPIIFGELGLLADREALCYPGLEYNLFGAQIPQDKNVVCDENYITSKGPATAMEFALQLVEVLAGRAKRRDIAADLLFELNETDEEKAAADAHVHESGGCSCCH